MSLCRLLLVLTLATLCGCGSEEPESKKTLFEFRIRGYGESEAFRVEVTSAEVAEQARAQLLLPESERTLFAIGGIQAGNDGVNLSWSWHFSGVRLTEMSIELCDGIPSMVEADPDYWLNSVKQFCPWSSYVYREIQ